jgi:hypothetical protein
MPEVEGVNEVEPVNDRGARLKEAQVEVETHASKLATVGAHTARMALLRVDDPGVGLGWVDQLRMVTGALQEALEDVRDLMEEE